MTTLNGASILPQNDVITASTAPAKRKRSKSVDEHQSSTSLGATKQFSGFSRRLQTALPLLRKYELAKIILLLELIVRLERIKHLPSSTSL